ncbi:beta-CASP ribonuclease aCPSF1 [Candidatus Bathyarchaeota archaeon]|nr:beta-CASP ribonuclease aCPSF1 [Candidatus Bathyarchaeota archaeon]
MRNQNSNGYAKVRECILECLPKEAEVTRIEFEGSKLAVYVKNTAMLLEQNYIISDIVTRLHKRVVIRSDPSIRISKEKAEKIIENLAPKEAEITSITFDLTLGEVIIEAKKPGLVIGKEGIILQEIIKATAWRPKVIRAPLLNSKIIASTRHILHSESEERTRILRNIGERIFRPTLTKQGSVRLTFLGGFREVGRSAILLETEESCILLDCGIKPSDQDLTPYPRFDVEQFNLDRLDAVVISHAHVDHCAMAPFLFKYDYDGPVYCSEPTSTLMPLLQLDYLDVASKEGSYAPYDQKDVREEVLHIIPLKYGVVNDIAPGVKLTLYDAGHILGSSIVHIHIGEGFHNIVYTGDFKFGKTTLLDSATSNFPRVETLIIESTYGAPEDVMPERSIVEANLIESLNEILKNGGKVLIPVPAVGRAQEIMIVLNNYMKNKKLIEAPIYIEGMISEATAIHTVYPEYLSKSISDQILHKNVNPFQSEYFTIVNHPSEREEIVKGGPSIIMATSGMLEGGPAIDYFKYLAPEEKNAIIFVSYQIEGTLGNKIKNGLKEVSLLGSNGKMELIKIKAKVEFIEGFSGHSDRNQLLSFLSKIKPKPSKIIVGHGERRKCESLAASINKKFGKAIAPENLETIRLR